MNLKKEWKILTALITVFIVFYFLPMGEPEFVNAIHESLFLTKDYAREHVILCLVPALFIAGAIGVFISQQAVMKYLGARAKKIVAYGVASVSGSILAVCSCTILPLFSGIYKMGAGLGPAVTFLYAGPAINVLAIVLTARVLGIEMGIARAVGAIVFSIIIGFLMHLIFIKEEREKARIQANLPEPESKRPLWKTALYFASMVGILVFANFGKADDSSGIWNFIFSNKWLITSVFALLFGVLAVWIIKLKWFLVLFASIPSIILAFVFPAIPEISFGIGAVAFSIILNVDKNEEGKEWFESTWTFAKQILPLLFFGVLIAGFLLGRPGHEGIIPSEWVNQAVGGNSIFSNFFASISGAFMYFATLTEVPILQGLIDNGMGKGPALALLLAGPALSLPNMLVIRSVMGTKKTVVYVSLVVIMATISGIIYGSIF